VVDEPEGSQPTAERQPSTFEHYLSLGASVVAPVTVISGLLFYFGYVSARAQYAYYGVDVDTIGLSTQGYVMRSPQALLVPLLVLVVLSVALVACHLAVAAWVARARPDRARTAARRGLAAGVLTLAIGFVLVFAYPLLADWPYYALATPVVVAVGAGFTAYCWRLASRLPSTGDTVPATASTPTIRRIGQVLLWVLVVACVFWSTATIAQWSGRGLARHDAKRLNSLPAVILDTKERLIINDPNVKETELAASTGQTFHYRYRNLRLLIDGHDRMFLVPSTWSASATTLVVPLDDSVRVRFQFKSDPP
jgi:hypothetical protein